MVKWGSLLELLKILFYNKVIKHFKKYQELSYKRNPPDPDINKKWEIYRKKQEEEKNQIKNSNIVKVK